MRAASRCHTSARGTARRRAVPRGAAYGYKSGAARWSIAGPVATIWKFSDTISIGLISLEFFNFFEKKTHFRRATVI